MGKKNLTLLVALIGLFALLVFAITATVSAHSGRLYPVHVNGKFGYIDRSGKIAIQPQFDRAGLFADGYGPVASPAAVAVRSVGRPAAGPAVTPASRLEVLLGPRLGALGRRGGSRKQVRSAAGPARGGQA